MDHLDIIVGVALVHEDERLERDAAIREEGARGASMASGASVHGFLHIHGNVLFDGHSLVALAPLEMRQQPTGANYGEHEIRQRLGFENFPRRRIADDAFL